MTKNFGIKLQELRKVYPRQLGEQLTAVAKAALGYRSDVIAGGVALEGLTLSIHHGERVGIIGRNGAGKSTLLQILAGITEPTSGSLIIDGKVTAILTLGVGLNEDLTGRENIYLNGETQGKSHEDITMDVDAIIQFCELANYIDLPLRTYSTGMKARLAFAIITHINPEILIIDETLSVGDAAFALKASARIKNLCERGAIVLIVSHSMQSIRDLCNRCIWLDNGNLVMDGQSEDVTRAYVDSVRREDDADHANRFRTLVGIRTFMPGYNLTDLMLTSCNQVVKRLISGQSLTVSCQWFKTIDASIGKFVLRCIRLDGALISENFIYENLVDAEEMRSNAQLTMTYPYLNLAHGLYRLQLEWRDDNDLLRAESTTVFEIMAEDKPIGGVPVLLNIGSVIIKKECEAGA